MMVFISVYTVVDGFFVSNFCKEDIFTAVNIIIPWPMMMGAFGFMIAAGGVALVGKTIGEGDKEKANQYFSSLVLITLLGGVVIAILSVIFIKNIAILLGSPDDLIDYCVTYGAILSATIPCFMLQNLFQGFLVAAEKPKLGFIFTIIAGFTNIVLDALFVAIFKFGLVGAASATAMSWTVGAILPVIYLVSKKNNSLLHFVKPKIELKAFGKVITNGSSELLANISVSLLNVLYNHQLISLVGENGVAAYGTMQYVCFLFMAAFFGYNVGVGPVISYNYGAKNVDELKNVTRKSFVIVSIISTFMTILGISCSRLLANIYVGYNKEICDLTTYGFRFYSLGFVIMGINCFASALFTSLNNGPVSLVISCGRTLVFQIISVFVLPLIFGPNGIWFAFACSEVLSLIVSAAFIFGKQKKYHY